MTGLVTTAITVLVVMVLPVLAGIWYAIRRRDPLTRPGCRHCGAALAFDAIAGHAPCPGCGRSGDALGEPRPLGRRSWKAAMLPPALLVIAGVGLMIGAEFLRPDPTSGARRRLPLSTLYGDVLVNRRHLLGEVEDLRARELDGEDIVGAARQALVSVIGEGPVPSDAASQLVSIATPSGSGPIDLAAIALLGVPGSSAEPPAADGDFALRVLHTCFRPYRVDGNALRQDRVVRVYSGAFEPVQAPIVRVLRVIACRVNGEPVDLVEPHGPPGPGPLILASDRVLQLPAPQAPAEAQPEAAAQSSTILQIEIDCEELLFRRFDAERLRDFAGRVIPAERWPQPLARRQVTITLDR